MAGTSNISKVMNHLAWLREQLGTEINRGNAYAGALLTYNAAAMLQAHFVFPSSDEDRIQSPAGRTQAAKLIDDFVWEVRSLFQEAKSRQGSGRDVSKATNALIDELKKQVIKVLRGLPRLAGLPAAHPVRFVELEHELDPTSLLIAGKGTRRRSSASKTTTASTTVSDTRKGLRTVLAGTLFINQSDHAEGRVESFVAGCSHVVSAALEQSLEDYVATLSGKSAERTEAIGRDIGSRLAARHST